MTDHEVVKGVWEGRLPVCVTLASDEQSSAGDTDNSTFYLLAPRCGYLSLFTDKLRLHFQRSDDNSEPWFEYKGRILKWNIPIGVLHECFCEPEEAPWGIQVHFKNFPNGLLQHCPDLVALEAHFIGRLKEANYLKHGSLPVEGLKTQEDRRQLWQGFQHDDLDVFQRVNERLMQCSEGWYKRVPFRFYVVTKRPGEEVPAAPTVVQDNFETCDEAHSPRTLGDLIAFALPQCSQPKVILHGIEPSRDTPLQWLVQHCAYPDNFLHFTVHVSA
eukprot:m.321712 g.321712  ORF g.321712 m.321712 type:complete len:273 (+) comp25772_c0_seq1:6-824(+)